MSHTWNSAWCLGNAGEHWYAVAVVVIIFIFIIFIIFIIIIMSDEEGMQGPERGRGLLKATWQSP